MANLNHVNLVLPEEIARLAPEMARIPVACSLFGVSRSWLYREAGSGNVRMVKIGARTLVDLQSVRKQYARFWRRCLPRLSAPAREGSVNDAAH
jgi:hypothetical protein